VGSYLVGPGTGWRLTNDDWDELYFLLSDGREELNRTHFEVVDLHDKLRDDAHTEVWLARGSDGRVDGFVALHLGRKASDRHTASLRIHLAADARGNGLGSKLMKVALKWADENGITRITATPYLSSRVSFFNQHGFDMEGIARNAARLQGGEYVDVIQLARVR
jgi:GNAT superfamily N-acetyltransferase